MQHQLNFLGHQALLHLGQQGGQLHFLVLNYYYYYYYYLLLQSQEGFALQQKVIPLSWRFSVRFPVSVAFIVAVVGASGDIIVLLPTYDTSVYVSLIRLKLVNLSCPVKSRLPKTAFEILLAVVVVVVLVATSCSPPPPTDVVVPVITSVVALAD